MQIVFHFAQQRFRVFADVQIKVSDFVVEVVDDFVFDAVFCEEYGQAARERLDVRVVLRNYRKNVLQHSALAATIRKYWVHKQNLPFS